MRLRKAKSPLAVALTLSIVLVFAGIAIWKASRALHRASEEVTAEENLKFAVSRLDHAVPSGVEWINSPAVFNDAAFFAGRLYVCGPSASFPRAVVCGEGNSSSWHWVLLSYRNWWSSTLSRPPTSRVITKPRAAFLGRKTIPPSSAGVY